MSRSYTTHIFLLFLITVQLATCYASENQSLRKLLGLRSSSSTCKVFAKSEDARQAGIADDIKKSCKSYCDNGYYDDWRFNTEYDTCLEQSTVKWQPYKETTTMVNAGAQTVTNHLDYDASQSVTLTNSCENT